jgi:hypothetical protein
MDPELSALSVLYSSHSILTLDLCSAADLPILQLLTPEFLPPDS